MLLATMLHRIKAKLRHATYRSRFSRQSLLFILLLVTYMYLNWTFEESRIVYFKEYNQLRHENLQVENNKNVHVLLSGYMRSGSYFTGKLLSSIPDTFPYMEPLWRVSIFGYFTDDNKLCDTRWPSCRRTQDLPTAYGILKSIYNCQLDNIRSLIDTQIRHPNPSNVAKVWITYARCNSTRSPCFSSFIQNCTGSRIRLSKVIRMSLAATRPLLETDKYLKIIQLVRDPRGIIGSRLLKTGWYPLKLSTGNYTPIISNAQALCKRMAEDYAAGKQLMTTLPNRVKFIRYDDLIYKFHQAVWDNITTFIGVKSTAIRRVPINTDNSFDWRGLLNKDVLDIIDKECSFVYKALGYVPLRHHELENTSLLSFRPYFEVG